MDSNLISLFTLGIKLCPCLPVDMYSLLLCLILWLGCTVEVSCRICSCILQACFHITYISVHVNSK